MLIVCPTCATAYQIAPAALGAAGATVRCAQCKNTWFATAERRTRRGGTGRRPLPCRRLRRPDDFRAAATATQDVLAAGAPRSRDEAVRGRR